MKSEGCTLNNKNMFLKVQWYFGFWISGFWSMKFHVSISAHSNSGMLQNPDIYLSGYQGTHICFNIRTKISIFSIWLDIETTCFGYRTLNIWVLDVKIPSLPQYMDSRNCDNYFYIFLFTKNQDWQMFFFLWISSFSTEDITC